MYPTFAEYLTEGKEGKLMHLTHLEDVLLDDWSMGITFIFDVLREFHHMLSGSGVSRSMNVTTKWDGAPSVVFGPDPRDGKFFVATKSAFNKVPKLMKSHAEIAAAYGDASIGRVLGYCLDYLSVLQPSRILQGDLLFVPGSVKEQTVGDTSYLTFRPNTILYAVDATSQLGHQILRAQIGIVIHTMYTGSGTSLDAYRAGPISPMVFSSLKHASSVLTLDAAYDDMSGTVTFTTEEEADYTLAVQRVRANIRGISAPVFNMISADPIKMYISMFLNQQVRQGRTMSGPQTADAFMAWLDQRAAEEMSKRSSVAGQAAIRDRFAVLQHQLVPRQRELGQWFELHRCIADAKLMIIRKLAQVSRVQTFIPTASGLQVTGPEGFVAVSHTGRMVKLVDRLGFSRANFLAAKEWT